ncbi:MAG: hypothetical protein VYB54_16605 [Pseudomonadota bacterium]|nr:hypothetical protein [Pseudomonadota bacterium]
MNAAGRNALLALLLALGLATTAAAQEWADRFNAYLVSPDYLDAIAEQLDLIEKEVAPECVHVVDSADRVAIRIRREPAFEAGIDWPVAGQWREQLAVERCGREVLHNLLVTAAPDRPPHFTLLLPGSTLAKPETQVAAARPVVAVAEGRYGRECPAGMRQIVETRFDGWRDGSEGRPPAEQTWRETWTVRLCERTVDVNITFEPNGKGGRTWTIDIAR